MRSEWSTLKKLMLSNPRESSPLIEITAKGNPISFTTDVSKALKKCVVNISPVQSGTGDPSPINIRPITGWNGCNVIVSPTQVEQDGKVYSIPFGQIIYGCSVDAVTGQLAVTWGGATLDGTNSQTYGFGSYPYILMPGGSVYKNQGSGTSTAKTNIAVPTSVTNNNIIRFANGIDGVTDKTSFGNLMRTTPMQIVAELTEPIILKLDPVTIKTLAGQNHIWSNANGDLEIIYLKKGA